ncbi:hypothetical protein XENORESO_014101 [Xenotaenia resolanae]|uniref:Cadherin domain-containing protein n=1 Tax=Xenotaenia resolanae TaxID=208358 RepID=A0ABV0XAE1_9TELE
MYLYFHLAAHVVVNIRVASLVEGVAFQSFSYNFSLPENNLQGTTVGQVRASSGSNLYEVSYSLKTHTDLFSINSDGAIMTTKELDKEQQEWYILDVRIQVEDVNESPEFSSKDYEASVFMIAAYKTPVIQVKALDPDVGDSSGLVYSLSDSSSFDVEPASGLVYVVSAADLGGKTVPLEVKATDGQGLYATATVKVIVEDSASSSDVTIISLNQLANVVESKVPELEESLGKVLGWAVNIIQVWSSVGEETRMLRASVRTMVSFVAHDKGEAISAEEVRKKLQSASNDVKAELVLLFGDGVNFNVETGSPSSTSDQVAVIVLGILLGVTVLGLIVAVVFVVRFKRNGKRKESDKESFDIDSQADGFTNMNFNKNSKSSQQLSRNPYNSTAEDREKAQWDKRAGEQQTSKKDSPRFREHKNSESDESHTSAL